MRRTVTGCIITVLASATVALAPAGAGATDFCVAPAFGCAGGQLSTLQAALDAAKTASGPDTVRLPAGTVQGPGAYDAVNPDNTVDLVGAGRDMTVVTTTAVARILDLRNDAAVSDLTVRQPNPPVPGQDGTLILGTADRVGFQSVDDDGDVAIYGTARHLLLTGSALLDLRGTIEDSDLEGFHLYTGTADAVVRRVRSVGPDPIGGQNRNLVISSSLFVSTTPGGTVAGFSPSPVPQVHATFVLSNVTLVGAGGSCTGLEISGDSVYNTPPDDLSVTDATLANSIVRGCPISVRRDATSNADHVANLTIFNSDLDLAPAAVVEVGSGTLTAGPGDGNFFADPLFAGLPGLEQALQAGSPAIDHGLTHTVSTEESTTDLAGNPRVVDGNGDGVATRDLGAFEYQPPVAPPPPPPGPGAAHAAAAVRSIALSPGAFRAAGRGASISARRKRPIPVGTTVRLALTDRAAVTLTVQRRASGRRVGKRCVAPTRRNRRARACVRYVSLRGSVVRAAGAPARFHFSGRWRGRALSPGSYRLTARAGRMAAKSAAFRILR